jgi:OOP family OmpA-OmpF porin
LEKKIIKRNLNLVLMKYRVYTVYLTRFFTVFCRTRLFYLVNSSILIICIFSLPAKSQDKKYIQPPLLGVNLIFNDFSRSDSSLHAPARSNRFKAGLSMNYLKGFTPRLDLNATLAGSFEHAPDAGSSTGNEPLYLEADASLRLKILPGLRHINPFLQAGMGISRFSGYYGLFAPAGIGVQISLPGEAFLLFQVQDRIPVTFGQAGHLYYSLGIAGIIGKRKRVKPKIRPAPTHGFFGRITPRDSDGDGIPDSLDACPNNPGLAIFSGCPDTDGDGIPDKDDKCPTKPGPMSNQGCPLADSFPFVQKEIRKKIELDARNIFFETNKYVLLPASDKALDEVVAILKTYPNLKLDIEGHTDNSGTDQKNIVLSKRRAKAVLDYLVVKGGIEKRRLSSAGFGSTRPVADNDKIEGRALNRRVEFRLRYE